MGISGIGLLQLRQDQLQVADDGLGIGLVLDVVGADQEDYACGMERENILAQADEHAARGVAANAAIGDLHTRKAAAHVIAPAVGDRIAQENEGVLVRRGRATPSALRRSVQIFWNQSARLMGPAPGRPSSVAGI